MSAFRTTFDVPSFPFDVDHSTIILSVGSCFAQVMAEQMQQLKYRVTINPHGILYNPLSMSNALISYCQANDFIREDIIIEVDGLWHSFDHHGSISASSREQLISNMQMAYEEGRKAVLNAHLIICTFGTSFVFQLGESENVVANCHKLPASSFSRRMASSDEMYRAMLKAISTVRSINSTVRFLFTVSPIRHVRDGMVANMVSKARLIELCAQLSNNINDCHYFPAYELMMDDLRDYRYYAEDMIHPSQVAHRYIWQHFVSTCMDKHSAKIAEEISKLHKSLNHRPIHPSSPQHIEFIESIRKQLAKLKATYPSFDFTWEEGKLAELQ